MIEKAPIEDYEAAATELNFLIGRQYKLIKRLSRLSDRPTAPLLQAVTAGKFLISSLKELERLMKINYPDCKGNLLNFDSLPDDLQERILEVNFKNKGSY